VYVPESSTLKREEIHLYEGRGGVVMWVTVEKFGWEVSEHLELVSAGFTRFPLKLIIALK
jgi:hypothetical protein